jgi:diphosphomevalonate decarboxylase
MPTPANRRARIAQALLDTSCRTATVPSNIAFVKYWGKRDEARQWPANDSLSMTLRDARTITAAARHGADEDVLLLPGDTDDSAPHASDKARRHLDALRRELGFHGALAVMSHNTFPTGAGIASSASGFGALTLAAIAAWTGADDLATLAARGFGAERLAHLARLGSGSAARSFFAPFALWRAGEAPEAQSVTALTPPRLAVADVIVLVASGPKPVSSSTAHRAAWTSSLFAVRLAGVRERLARVHAGLVAGDLDAIGPDLEAEALEMHAVMMTATPPAQYLTDATRAVCAWVREERLRGAFAAYFTIDAGPNVHLICRADAADLVAARVAAAFPDLACLVDGQGTGPELVASARPLALVEGSPLS